MLYALACTAYVFRAFNAVSCARMIECESPLRYYLYHDPLPARLILRTAEVDTMPVLFCLPDVSASPSTTTPL